MRLSPSSVLNCTERVGTCEKCFLLIKAFSHMQYVCDVHRCHGKKSHLVWYKKSPHVDTAVLKNSIQNDGNTLNDKVGSGQKEDLRNLHFARMGHGLHEIETQRANVIHYFQEKKNSIRRETASSRCKKYFKKVRDLLRSVRSALRDPSMS